MSHLLVEATHEDLPGVVKETSIEAYRVVWYAKGWRSADDPDFVGELDADEPPSMGVHEDTPLSADTHGVVDVNWRQETVASWTRYVMATDPDVTGTTLSVVDGMAWIHGTGGNVTTSNRRDLYIIPGTERWEDMEVTGLWWGGPVQSGSGQPQHGFGLRVNTTNGVQRAVMIWHDTLFGIVSLFNVGVWAANVGGGGFALPTGGSTDAGARTVTAGSRTSGLSTLTVGANHKLEVGQLVNVAVADTGYNGAFPIEVVGATTIGYRQAAAGNDGSSGTGVVSPFSAGFGSGSDQLARNSAVSAAVRTNNVVTATVPADHAFQIGDRVNVDLSDNTYDGSFRVHAVTDTTVAWVQVAADDASGGTGTITKVFPYICRARLVGTSVEIAWKPYQGLDEATAALNSDITFGDTRFSAAFDLSANTGDGVAPTGRGGVAILAGHIGSSVDAAGNPTRRCQYGNLLARRL